MAPRQGNIDLQAGDDDSSCDDMSKCQDPSKDPVGTQEDIVKNELLYQLKERARWNLDLVGWLLFVVSAGLYGYSSLMLKDWINFSASAAFLVADFLFLVSYLGGPVPDSTTMPKEISAVNDEASTDLEAPPVVTAQEVVAVSSAQGQGYQATHPMTEMVATENSRLKT